MNTARLGAGQLNDPARQSLRAFLASRRGPAGGFVGGGDREDLYYTLFGLACERAVGTPFRLKESSLFLDRFGPGDDLDLVHLSYLIQSRRLLRPVRGFFRRWKPWLERVEQHRAADGGFARIPGQRRGTAYGSYLALLAYQAAGRLPPRPLDIVSSLHALACADGGFANDDRRPFPTLAATAAASLVLAALDRPPPGAWEWILAQQAPPGGFRLSALAPFADLLSTAVGFFALSCWTIDLSPMFEQTRDYIDSLWDANGGFRGAWTVDEPDVEYTFYGLLALGCIERLRSGKAEEDRDPGE